MVELLMITLHTAWIKSIIWLVLWNMRLMYWLDFQRNLKIFLTIRGINEKKYCFLVVMFFLGVYSIKTLSALYNEGYIKSL